MINRLRIDAGRGVTIARAGAFVSIVTAQGNLNLRALDAQGVPVLETLCRVGMAFDLHRTATEFLFESDEDQLIEVYISASRMDYTPEGSGVSDISFTRKVIMPGLNLDVIPANGRRRKVEITPQQETWIGGSNMAWDGSRVRNGRLIPPNEPFVTECAGAVAVFVTDELFYGLEGPNNAEPAIEMAPGTNTYTNDGDWAPDFDAAGVPYTDVMIGESGTIDVSWGIDFDGGASAYVAITQAGAGSAGVKVFALFSAGGTGSQDGVRTVSAPAGLQRLYWYATDYWQTNSFAYRELKIPVGPEGVGSVDLFEELA